MKLSIASLFFFIIAFHYDALRGYPRASGAVYTYIWCATAFYGNNLERNEAEFMHRSTRKVMTQTLSDGRSIGLW